MFIFFAATGYCRSQQICSRFAAGSFRRSAFEMCGCGRRLRFCRDRKFSIFPHRTLLPHASNAARLNEPLVWTRLKLAATAIKICHLPKAVKHVNVAPIVSGKSVAKCQLAYLWGYVIHNLIYNFEPLQLEFPRAFIQGDQIGHFLDFRQLFKTFGKN